MGKRIHLLLLTVIAMALTCDQPMTGEELLTRSIQYHDSGNNWASFEGELAIELTFPDESVRQSNISINLPEQYFHVKEAKGDNVKEYELNKEECHITFNGRTEFAPEEAEDNRLNCEAAKRTRNYYTFLYGLPMKLKDEGTHIAEQVEYKTVNGTDYVVLKATYDEEVGSDIWFIYLNPETYAMEMYQFYKKDESGNMDPESGEYIMLSEEMEIGNIKMPRIRSWYYNSNDEFLGTDTLN